MNEIIGLIRPILPYALAGLGVYLLWKFGLGFLKGGATSLGGSLSGAVPAIALTGAVAIGAFAVIAIWQPAFLTGLFGVKGPNGPARIEAEARADLLSVYILNPGEDVSTWPSKPAQAAAEAVTSEYSLVAAKNKAGMSQADAERACYLPKGHPDRVLWDQASLDPCSNSIPAGVQVAQNRVGEISKNAGDAIAKLDTGPMNKELSKPLGQAPADADPLVKKWIYDLPLGLFVIIGLVIGIVVLAGLIKAVLRSPRAA